MATPAAVPAGVRPAPALALARARLRRQPTLAVDAAVGAAWALLATMAHALHGAPALSTALALWAVMCVAMMLPAATAAARHVARNSLAWRRGRAVGGFVAVYLGLWVAFGAVVLAVASLLPAPTAPVLAALLLVAAGYELTPLKLRALRGCHRSVPLAPTGPRAALSLVRFGLVNGGSCVASCWALMLFMALVTSGHLFWMAGLTAIVSAQKLLLKPQRTTRICAGALGAAAALVLLAG